MPEGMQEGLSLPDIRRYSVLYAIKQSEQSLSSVAIKWFRHASHRGSGSPEPY